ncbi:hypothetical protein NBRC116583_14670 [Arenicella sp. 4NH20-0111]|uniref:VOC family protein n=1 Tax=Arenicella sp. 4NH20-0111 TaxID=3127648 RepID=UPI00310752C4
MKLSLVSIPVQDPIKAHQIYTTKLGFQTKTFDKNAQLVIVISAEDPDGSAILLEPCVGSFAESYQRSAFDANLPIMIFSVNDVDSEMERLRRVGVTLRPDIENSEWGLSNLFEDGCGNILMIEEASG